MRSLVYSCVLASLVLFGLGRGAAAAEYCVSCSSPDASYRCEVGAAGTTADPREVDSWRTALELPPDKFPLIQSTKSMIGHTLGAAGALESVAAVDQLAHGYVHPSINSEPVHPLIAPIEKSIPRQALEKPLEHVIKASFGFGDVNGALLFKKWA